MRGRCSNLNRRDSKYYALKGIAVVPEWDDFENFAEWALRSGYETGLSIDRINGDGDYCPENCRWIPMADQQRNKSNNRFYAYKGKTQTLSEWAREYGIDYKTLADRMDKFGFSFEEALRRPTKVPRNTKYVLYKGVLHTYAELEQLCGVPRRVIGARIKRGWGVEKAIATPYERKDSLCRS